MRLISLAVVTCSLTAETTARCMAQLDIGGERMHFPIALQRSTQVGADSSFVGKGLRVDASSPSDVAMDAHDLPVHVESASFDHDGTFVSVGS